jgi:hypothetical protein
MHPASFIGGCFERLPITDAVYNNFLLIDKAGCISPTNTEEGSF